MKSYEIEKRNGEWAVIEKMITSVGVVTAIVASEKDYSTAFAIKRSFARGGQLIEHN